MDKITIEAAEYGFKVSQGDKYAEVGWDEMLGLVAALTMPESRPCLQWMKTKEQHEVQVASWSKTNEMRSFEIDIEPIEVFVCEECKKMLPKSERGFHASPILCKNCEPF